MNELAKLGFNKDLQALLTLDHPNILKVHEVYEDELKFSIIVEPLGKQCDLLIDAIINHEDHCEKDASGHIL